jgi:hypothetical protein
MRGSPRGHFRNPILEESMKIRIPIVGLTALIAAAITLTAPGSPAKAVGVGGHWLLMNTLTGKCATQTGTTGSLYTTACPNAGSTTINHSLLWYANGYNQIVNYHSDSCMIVTGATPGSPVWLTGPTSAGSGQCTPVTVDEWDGLSGSTYLQITNMHSHFFLTAGQSSTGITQNRAQSTGQYWDLVPTNS